MRLGLVVLLAVSMPLLAQSDSDLTPLFDAYTKERAAAKGTPEVLAIADRLAARAAEARKSENLAGAARFIRDARWALPAVPHNMPEGASVLGYNRLRHGLRANAVRYNRDGTQMLTCGNDRTVRVWDVATGREVMVYRGHTTATDGDSPILVADALFLPDGERVASGGGKAIHLWELKTGKTLKTLVPEVAGDAKKDAAKAVARLVKCLAVSDDGKMLAAGYDDKFLRVWNLETGKVAFTSAPHTQRIEGVSWQPKGKFVAVVDSDGFLAVYDPSAENKSPIYKVQVTDGGNVSAYAVRFAADGSKILTGGSDKSPRLTPAPTPEGAAPPNIAGATQKLPPHEGDVTAVDVTADGKFYASGGRDKTVRLVDTLGQVVRSFTAPSNITALAVRPDGLQVAAACEDGSVRVWDFLSVDDQRTAAEAKEPLWAAAVNADGTLFATAGGDKAIRLYSLNGKLLRTLEGSSAPVTSLVFLSADKLLSAGGDKVLRLWDAKAGKALGEWPGHAAAVLALAATPDGRVAVSGAADKVVNGWNAETGKTTWTWTARSAVSALAISKDGKRVVVGTADGGMSVLKIDGDKATLAQYVNAHVSGVASLVFNADNTRLASAGGDGLPKIWALPENGPPTTLLRMAPALKPTAPGPVALSAIAFSPDGRQVAVGGADKVVRLYDTTTGLEVRSLRGCTDWITALAYAPDGERLIAVAADKVVRIFDIYRTDAGVSGGHDGPARAVAVSKDGKLIASVGDDKVIRLWSRATGTEVGTIPCPGDQLYGVAFIGPNTLATGGKDKNLRLWSLDTRKEIAVKPLGQIYGITPGADGSRLGVWSRTDKQDTYSLFLVAGAAAPVTMVGVRTAGAATIAADLTIVAAADENEKGVVLLYDFATKAVAGKEWKVTDAAIVDIGFSPDRKLLIAVDESGTATIADVEKRETVATTGSSKEGVNALLISPAGNRFAVLGTDGGVRICDFAGKDIKAYTLPSPPNNACFSADGKALITANADGSLTVLELP